MVHCANAFAYQAQRWVLRADGASVEPRERSSPTADRLSSLDRLDSSRTESVRGSTMFPGSINHASSSRFGARACAVG